MRRPTTLLIALLFAALAPAAPAQQSDNDRKIAEQRRIIAELERGIADGERELNGLQKGRKTAQARADKLTRQIVAREQKLQATERQALLLQDEIARTDSTARALSAELDRNRRSYAEMTRAAYRNYRHNNFLTYIFASKNFSDVARRISLLRSVADLRRNKLAEIERLEQQTAEKRAELERRNSQLDSVKQDLTSQRKRLEDDRTSARKTVNQLSAKEKTALKNIRQKEARLDNAMSELRRLTKGNKVGDSFSAKATNLHLPVEGGRILNKRGLDTNMAEITGPKGARVISIYDGKVIKIVRNRIDGLYTVILAHGEYISTYTNLSSVTVKQEQSVKRNQQLGVIGMSVDENLKSYPSLIFGIYAPSPNVKLRATDFFKK